MAAAISNASHMKISSRSRIAAHERMDAVGALAVAADAAAVGEERIGQPNGDRMAPCGIRVVYRAGGRFNRVRERALAAQRRR